MKRRNEKLKKLISIALAVCMLGTMAALPEQASAEEDASTVTVEEWFDLGETQVSAEGMSLFSLADGSVALKNGNYEDWIDRLDLTDAAVIRTFYNTLVEGSDNDGNADILIDNAYFSGDNVIEVATVTGTLGTGVSLDAKGKEVLNNYTSFILAAYSAFDRDHPEVFWLNGGCRYGYSASAIGNNYTIKIMFLVKDSSDDLRADGYTSEQAIEEAIAARDSKVNEIITAVSQKSDYEKIRHFNDILTTTNEYNTSDNLSAIGHDCRECVSALAGKTGTEGPVCEAYARAFKVLCDVAEIPCVLVDGNAKNDVYSSGEAHMWNYVQLENRWYAVDVTWNDPKVQGVPGAQSKYESEEWLLVGSDTEINNMKFIVSHPVTNRAISSAPVFTNGPELSLSAYDPNTVYKPTSLTAAKTKTSYIAGDTLDTDDITVTLLYEDGYAAQTTGFTTNAEEIDMSTAGTKSLVVSYGEGEEAITATIVITVAEKQTAPANPTEPENTPEQGNPDFSGESDSSQNDGNSETSKSEGTDSGTNSGSGNTSGGQGAAEPAHQDDKLIANAASGVQSVVKTKSDGTASLIKVNSTKKKSLSISPQIKAHGTKYDIKTIEGKAFVNCKKVTKLTLPDKVTTIKKNAFYGMKKLKTITLKGKKSITVKRGAFKGLNTKKITIKVNKKMSAKELKKFKKVLKKAGFKGKVKK